MLRQAAAGGEGESRLVYRHHPSSGEMEMSVDRGVTRASGGRRT